jgi:4-alpha-glucanotransferase
LGVITPEVEELRDSFGFPGMKILQFAFDNTEENAFLPHNYTENCICYTGTHDNNTTVGWYQKAGYHSKKKCESYMNAKSDVPEDICWDFIRTALASTARYALIPIQDLLCKGEECRMNMPSVAAGNWAYRFRQEELDGRLAWRMADLAKLYGRGGRL